MKKRNIWVYLGVFCVTLLLFLGVNFVQTKFFPGKEKEKEIKGEYALKAVYLKGEEEGQEIFVDLVNDTPFKGTIPEEELYGQDGEKISREDLKNGDVLNVWGNGVLAESYPAQYHGITKMERVEEENQEYIEKYRHYAEEFFVKEDPSQVPALDLCYTQNMGVATASVLEYGSYTWSYEDETGETVTATTDAAHVLQWERYTQIKTQEPLQVSFQFNPEAENVEVFCWPQEQHEKALEEKDTASIPQGEQVALIKDQEGRWAIQAEPGFIYQVTGIWEQGKAEYGFWVKK